MAGAALLAVALWLSLVPARLPGRSSAIWLATGLEIAFLLRLPRRDWAASLAVFFAVTMGVIAAVGSQRWTLTLGAPLLNTLGAWATARWLAQDRDWVAGRSERLVSWLRFALIGGLVMPALWGVFGATMILAAFSLPWTWQGFADAALGRYVNNALGTFVLVPLALRLRPIRRLRDPARLAETVLSLGAFALLAATIFFAQASVLPLFVVLLPVIVLLFRLEFIATTACMVILGTAAIGAAFAHAGPFVPMADGDWVLAMRLTQCWLMAIFATIVLMTGLLAERHALSQRAIELAHESARMKSEFLAKMSHEIRTPLNAIIGFAELLRHEPALPPESRQHVRIIDQSGKHLLGLINEVLDMAKVEAGRLELALRDVHLPSLLESVVAMLTLRAERKGLRLELQAAADLPVFVRADELKLRQVFLNLLGNAVKFTERGQVTLAVRWAAADARRGALQVEVVDTGPGIAADELPRLFVAFHQGHAGRHAQGGTGLGLVISKSFVELMGGRLAVRSTPGEGSCFSFDVQLALADGEAPAALPRRAIALAPGQRPLRALVADDVEANRTLMALLMRRFGIAVETVENGQRAVDLFPALRPDLIWMDLVMPVLHGDAAARRIRALDGGAAAKIVCLTASAFNGERGALGEPAFDAVLVKPASEARLVETMQRLLGLEFVYAEPGADAPAPAAAADGAPYDAAPPDWRHAFEADIVNGDLGRMQARLDLLPPAQAALRARLQALLDQLDLEGLAALGRAPAPAVPRPETAPAA